MSDRPLQAIQDVVRIPFYQYENTARGGSGLDSYYDQFIVNLIPEKIQDYDTQTVKQQLSKRPGITGVGAGFDMTGLFNDSSAVTVRDLIPITAVYDVHVAAFFDSSINKFYIVQMRPKTNTTLVIGSFTGATNDDVYLTEISQSSGGSLLPGVAVHWVKNDLTLSKGYYATVASGSFSASTLTAITNTAFPPNQTPALISVGRIINQRDTFYVATLDGRIWNSYAGMNDINDWDNANGQIGSIKVNMYPDQCLGIERHKGQIVAFSRNSIEFFNDVGTSENNPCTLQVMDQAFIKFGTVKPNLIRNIDDTLFWIGYGSAGQEGLWALDGYTPIKLSNPYVDSLIAGSAANVNTYSFNLQSCFMNGKRQLFINNMSSGNLLRMASGSTTFVGDDTYPVVPVGDANQGSLVFNIEDKTWWFFQHGISPGNVVPYFSTSFASPAQGDIYTQYCLLDTHTAQACALYQMSTTNVYEDNDGFGQSYPIFVYAQTNPLWFGNEKRKRINKLKVITNRMGVRPAGDTNTYSMYLIYNRDNLTTNDSSTTGSANLIVRKINIPTGRIYWNNLGMGRVWTFAFIEKSKLPLRLDSFEVEIQQGSH